ncbi:MAG: nucleotidyltransferase family protein [Methanoregula sp.]|jgi:predicted nucleotidyltransferase|uniref:nucleotidyltransferase family protein n=1 Tax=Methanoregula sp. TaxID=2052170 RepID=UPI003C1A290D
MKSNRQDILASLKKLKREVAQEYSVKSIGVFGSVARDEQTGQSDIDLLVEFSKPVGFVTFIRLENFLSEQLGKPVDLVTPDSLKPVIRQDVLSEVIYV